MWRELGKISDLPGTDGRRLPSYPANVASNEADTSDPSSRPGGRKQNGGQNILQLAFPAPTAFLVTRLSNTAKFYSNKINFEARAPLLVLL